MTPLYVAKKLTDADAKDGEVGSIVADRRLYLTRGERARVVEHGDPDAAILLASPGTTIPAAQVAALGLDVSAGKVKQDAKAAQPVGLAGGALVSHDQETGPALKKAAEEQRAKELAEGKMQTKVAVLQDPPGQEEADKRKAEVAEEEESARADEPEPPAGGKRAAKKTAAKKGASK